MTSSFSAAFTVAQAQAHARQQGLDALDTQLLLGALLQQSRAWLIAHGDATLNAAQQVQWLSWLNRRASGEPVAYILGDKAFFGLTLAVNPDVLIPRPDTEALVEWALEVLVTMPANAPSRPLQVLDLGTGSGAIALAIQHERPDVQVTAVDASEAALRVAQANAQRLNLPVRFRHGHWLTPVQGQYFDLIVSNPPYIAECDPHMPALSHEPRQALTSGPDGLDDIQHIVTNSMRHLKPGGWLLLEHGYDQSEAVAKLFSVKGFTQIGHRMDLGGHVRCTGAQVGGAA
jgi:release factor glutamine methyltransferase